MRPRTIVQLRARNALLHKLADVALAIAGIAANLGIETEAQLAKEIR